MELTLHDLIDTYDFNDLESTFETLLRGADFDPKDVSKYEGMFNVLKEDKDIVINDCKVHIHDCTDEHQRLTVEIPNTSYNTRSWSEWLGMNIDEETLMSYDTKKIICHCLFEMAFNGFEEKKSETIKGTKEPQEGSTMFDELDDLEEEEESKCLLKKILKHEIETSSSSEDFLR